MPVIAAGAILWRRENDELRVLMIHRTRYNDWSWPKGKLDKDEQIAEAAIREIKEETGLKVNLGVKLYVAEYRLDSGQKKQVHYWSAEVTDQALKNQNFTPDDEVGSFAWLSVKEAKKRMTYKHDNLPLNELLELEKANLLETTPVIVLRHAKATPRDEWSKGEATRPLLPVGAVQAVALTNQLAAFGPQLVVTSPWRRCLDTVLPFVAKHQIKMVERAPLTELGTKTNPDKALKLIQSLVQDQKPVVICSHRPSLPTIIEGLSAYAGKKLTKELKAIADLKPGEFYVLHFANVGKKAKSKIVSVEFGQ
jgi:8-oxo-dGTP diphosphatase